MRRHEPGAVSERGSFEADRAAGEVAELRTRIREQQRSMSKVSTRLSYAVLDRNERKEHWREVAGQYHESGYGERTPLDWMREAGRDPEAVALGREFLIAAEHGDAATIMSFLNAGFPANWQDPETGEAALHVAAACKARKVLRILLDTGFCDYLLRDAQGRLASELAYLFGEDPAAARLLGNKERKQAEAQGVALKRRGTPTHQLVRR